jgi:DNA-binding CsgD family transcriptional regulator
LLLVALCASECRLALVPAMVCLPVHRAGERRNYPDVTRSSAGCAFEADATQMKQQRGSIRRAKGSALGPPPGLQALRFRIGGEQFALLACDVPRQTGASPALDALSPSERKVVELLARGCKNSEIARLRSVSIQTVANQLASAFRRLNVGSRRELVALATRHRSEPR